MDRFLRACSRLLKVFYMGPELPTEFDALLELGVPQKRRLYRAAELDFIPYVVRVTSSSSCFVGGKPSVVALARPVTFP